MLQAHLYILGIRVLHTHLYILGIFKAETSPVLEDDSEYELVYPTTPLINSIVLDIPVGPYYKYLNKIIKDRNYFPITDCQAGLVIKKKDGGWRPCGDYRRLNTATVPDRYPLPNIADFSSRVSGSTVFSKLDLQKGYYQVPVEDVDIQKTAIITPFGMFEFLRMPFGLRNAGNTFQRLMDQILGDLPFCFVYVDDILVFSKDLSSHVQHLRDVLLLCREHGLTIGLPKCQFAVSEIEFLCFS